MESSICHPSPLNTYFYVWEENLGLTRKLVENYLLFMCITNQFLALHPRSMDGLEEPFSAKKIFLQPTRSRFYWSVCNLLSCLRVESFLRQQPDGNVTSCIVGTPYSSIYLARWKKNLRLTFSRLQPDSNVAFCIVGTIVKLHWHIYWHWLNIWFFF